MKTKLVLGAVAAAVAVFSQGAFAQAASSPTRAEVKAEAKTSKTPAGEATGSVTPSKGSTADKAATKAEAKKSKTPAGEATGSVTPGKGSEVDRTARKSDAKAATKSGKTAPSDQPQPASDKPMK